MRILRRVAASSDNKFDSPFSKVAKRTSPAEESMSPAIQRNTVDFPDPDSPTIPRASPAATSKFTSHAATMDPV